MHTTYNCSVVSGEIQLWVLLDAEMVRKSSTLVDQTCVSDKPGVPKLNYYIETTYTISYAYY